MNSSTTYKLIGFVNFLDLIPDFVYPVFQNKNAFYFQNCNDNLISEFVEIPSVQLKNMIPVSNSNSSEISKDITVTINSQPIYAFQPWKEKIIYGDAGVLTLFFSEYQIPNSYIKREIFDFFKDEKINIPLNSSLFYYGTGRRKKAVARVRAYYGNGKIIVNNREIDNYFQLPSLRQTVKQPLVVSKAEKTFDIICNVSGGGVSGQANAIQLGIAKALTEYNDSLKPKLKSNGLLTRDSRNKERKKYGLKGARKASQHSKR